VDDGEFRTAGLRGVDQSGHARGRHASPGASVGGPTAKIGRPWTPVGDGSGAFNARDKKSPRSKKAAKGFRTGTRSKPRKFKRSSATSNFFGREPVQIAPAGSSGAHRLRQLPICRSKPHKKAASRPRVVGVFGVADQALDLGTRRVRSKEKAPLAVRKTLWRMPGDFPKNVNGRPKKRGQIVFQRCYVSQTREQRTAGC
jgi:hypothetical protein